MVELITKYQNEEDNKKKNFNFLCDPQDAKQL